ncbi:glycosyl transferase, partial [Candidatus Woesearchaeota archaeon]
MKILQIINAFYPPCNWGGAASVAYHISKTLAKRGHKVAVYTTNILSREKLFYLKENSVKISNVRVHYFHNTIFKPSLHFYYSPGIVNTVRREIKNYDIVHIHEYRSYISPVVGYYAKKFNIPFIIQAHGSLPRIGRKAIKHIYDIFLGQRLLKEATKVIALNKFEALQYAKFGVPKDRISIIPNGIDLTEYNNLPPKGSFRKTFSIPENKRLILYLGRIHWIKGIDLLVKACYLMKKHGYHNFVLVIAGPDDGYLHTIQQMVNQLGLRRSVIFTGPLYGKMKQAAYRDADVYVLPSRYDTFPMTILEAYACGVPVIASDIGGLKETVVNGRTGYLFSPYNVMDLANKILDLIINER